MMGKGCDGCGSDMLSVATEIGSRQHWVVTLSKAKLYEPLSLSSHNLLGCQKQSKRLEHKGLKLSTCFRSVGYKKYLGRY